MSAFNDALAFTLKWEGGYSNNPNDPGGATMKGVTQRVYTAYLQSHGLPNTDVRNITDDQLNDIYASEYWSPSHCQSMPAPVGVAVFDLAVNGGVGRAVKMLQSTLGVTADGIFGPGSLGALAAQTSNAADTSAFVTNYLNARENYYRTLATQNPKLQVFLKGWLNRVEALKTYLATYTPSA